jgi:uncharacterized protein (UPF0261 family)
MSIYVLATLDTKGDEAAWVCAELKRLGAEVTLIDVGCVGAPTTAPDIDRTLVFAAAGAAPAELAAAGDRGRAVSAAAEGAARLVASHFREGRVSAVLGLGGSAGTTIGTAAMRTLPLGVPKLMVSTLASGQVKQFVADKDIMMLNPVVDLAGLNRISRQVLSTAAAALAGVVADRRQRRDEDAGRPLVAATMFGVTTPCVVEARRLLEQAGYEVMVFHATGSGGRSMESLVREGVFAGVLDITTTELADELVGGFLSAGGDRLTAAGEMGVPQVVSVGATDMVNFYGPATVPAKFQRRTLHAHNPNVTLMRTTADECEAIGHDIGRKLAAARGPSALLLPQRGVSDLDRTGQPFDDPVARDKLFQSIRRHGRNVPIVTLDLHINDPEFARAAVLRLLELMKTNATTN